ncbi:maleylacetoacetate isomerase [Rhizobium changzhiense]|uniref:maleylacetoacetate isomerase n=1 Tax=Rhizobium changzhiense TaxID=2692317 RepID=UPI001F0B865D|nr:maleylacetoacetate isomerase [Rhizobium changzhiense]MCH4544613.1 maleylacetoacetate isomerase [Rhizobium changzhiense]
MMRLISRWQNSAGERVRIALNLKGIAYRYVPVSSLEPGEYRRLNPQGLLPALDIGGGRVVPQSSAILSYIEETYPDPSLLPEDPALRAEARGFAAHIASEMHALTVQRVRHFLRDDLGAGEAEVKRWLAHWLSLGFTALEETLARRQSPSPFCFGDRPSWADLHLIPQMSSARRLGHVLTPYPLLLAVEQRCVTLEAFRAARPEAQPDFPKTNGQAETASY